MAQQYGDAAGEPGVLSPGSPKVRIYARLSIIPKDKDNRPDPSLVPSHLDSQILPLREHASQRGWTVLGEYSDVISGTKDRRPGLDRLMKEMRHGEIILVTKLDRLARSTRHLLELADLFQSRSVQLVARDQEIDTSSAVGRMTFTVLGAVAELERSLIVDRTKAGLDVARAKLRAVGRNLGRPVREIPETKIRALVESRASLGEMGRRLVASRNTVKKWLRALGLDGNGQELAS